MFHIPNVHSKIMITEDECISYIKYMYMLKYILHVYIENI